MSYSVFTGRWGSVDNRLRQRTETVKRKRILFRYGYFTRHKFCRQTPFKVTGDTSEKEVPKTPVEEDHGGYPSHLFKSVYRTLTWHKERSPCPNPDLTLHPLTGL